MWKDLIQACQYYGMTKSSAVNYLNQYNASNTFELNCNNKTLIKCHQQGFFFRKLKILEQHIIQRIFYLYYLSEKYKVTEN